MLRYLLNHVCGCVLVQASASPKFNHFQLFTLDVVLDLPVLAGMFPSVVLRVPAVKIRKTQVGQSCAAAHRPEVVKKSQPRISPRPAAEISTKRPPCTAILEGDAQQSCSGAYLRERANTESHQAREGQGAMCSTIDDACQTTQNGRRFVHGNGMIQDQCTLQRSVHARVDVTMAAFLRLGMHLMHLHRKLFSIIRRYISLQGCSE